MALCEPLAESVIHILDNQPADPPVKIFLDLLGFLSRIRGILHLDVNVGLDIERDSVSIFPRSSRVRFSTVFVKGLIKKVLVMC